MKTSTEPVLVRFRFLRSGTKLDPLQTRLNPPIQSVQSNFQIFFYTLTYVHPFPHFPSQTPLQTKETIPSPSLVATIVVDRPNKSPCRQPSTARYLSLFPLLNQPNSYIDERHLNKKLGLLKWLVRLGRQGYIPQLFCDQILVLMTNVIFFNGLQI